MTFYYYAAAPIRLALSVHLIGRAALGRDCACLPPTPFLCLDFRCFFVGHHLSLRNSHD